MRRYKFCYNILITFGRHRHQLLGNESRKTSSSSLFLSSFFHQKGSLEGKYDYNSQKMTEMMTNHGNSLVNVIIMTSSVYIPIYI